MIITLILIIVITILLRYNCLNKENLSDEEYDLYTNVDHYRIGDLVQGLIHIKNYQSNLDLDKDTLIKFPNSIASDYIRNIDSKSLREHTNLNKNKELYLHKISIIKKLLKKYNKSESNNVIVHLRIGDILDHESQDPPNNQQFFDYINNDTKLGRVYEKYVKPISYYNNIINELNLAKVNKVIIIAGSHVKCPNYKLSSIYINKIKQLFKENGIHVTLRLGLHPDEDLILSANAKKFYGSGGSYSVLLELLNNST